MKSNDPSDSDDDGKLKELRQEYASRRRQPHGTSSTDQGVVAVEKGGVLSRIIALRSSLTDKMKKAAAARRKHSANPLDAPSKAAGVDLELLREIKAVFEDVGEDGEIGVAEDEFVRTFGPALCPGMSSSQVRCWFRGIDADCSGHVSWNEIGDFVTRYTDTGESDDDTAALVQVADRHNEALGVRKKYVSTQLEGACHRHPAHAGTVASALYMPSTDALFSLGSDNVVRNWNPVTLQANLAPVHVGTSWVVAMAPIVQGSRLCVFETNRIITVYNIQTAKSRDAEEEAQQQQQQLTSPRTGQDKSSKKSAERKVVGVAASATTEFCRSFASPGPHIGVGDSGLPVVTRYINAKHHVLGDQTHGVISTPTTLLEDITKKTTAADHLRTVTAGELVALADEEGSVDLHLLHQSDTPLPPVSRLLCHSGWITKLKAALDYDAIITSSTDGNVLMTHVEKGNVIQALTPQMVDGKRKPVFTFDASPAHHTLAYSTGRTVHVWSMTTGVCHAKLTDHDVAVTHVAVNGFGNEIIALQSDKTIKVWDTRMWRVVDVLVDKKTRQPEDVLSTVMSLPHRGLIVSGSSSLVAWRSIEAQELFDSGSKETLPIGGRSLREDILVAAQASPALVDDDDDGADLVASPPSPPSIPVPSSAEETPLAGTVAAASKPTTALTANKAVSTIRHLQPIIAMHVAPRSGLLIVMDIVKTIVWNLADGAPLTQWLWPLPGNSATTTFFDTSELRVLVGTDEGQVWWLNAASGHLIRQLRHTLPRSEVSCVANFETVIPALTAAGIGSHIALWVDDNNGRRLPEAPSTVLSVPAEYGVVMSLMRPIDNSNALVVATASGVTAVLNFVTKALMYSIPPPEHLGTAEFGISFRRLTAFVGHTNGKLRVFAMERDTLCISIAYFAAASAVHESVTAIVAVSPRTGVACGDTAGRISIFRMGGLIVDRDLMTKIMPGRVEGKLTERDVVNNHVDLVSCWNAHAGHPITALEYMAQVNRLVSAGSDRSVRIWDVEHIRLLVELGHRRPRQSIIDELPPPGEGPDYTKHPFIAESSVLADRAHSPKVKAKLPPVGEIDYGVTLPTPQSRREPSHTLLRMTAEGPEGSKPSRGGATLLPFLLMGTPSLRSHDSASLNRAASAAAILLSDSHDGAKDPRAATRPLTTPQPVPGNYTDLSALPKPLPALVEDEALSPDQQQRLPAPATAVARRKLRTPAVTRSISTASTLLATTGGGGRRRYTKEDVDALANTTSTAVVNLQQQQQRHSPHSSPLGRVVTAVTFSVATNRGDNDDWRTHDLLTQVARRTRALRNDLPQIDAPLIPSNLRSTLGEVARIKQSRDTETLDTMKASGGGGFRGLMLPSFQMGAPTASSSSSSKKGGVTR